jgi:hypothetical protein
MSLKNWIEFECLVIKSFSFKGGLKAKCLGINLADLFPKKHLRKLFACSDILVHLFSSFPVAK